MKKILVTIASIALFNSVSFAKDAVKKTDTSVKPSATMTKEQREEMASAHEKMATCLRSDKALDECKQEMMDACKDKAGSCSMMSHHGNMKHKKGSMSHEMNGSEE
jgi:bisphosphoglycerate-independent phosphoglycerate mutase (AlkP superfamily)